MLLLEVQIETGRQDKRRSATFELADEARLVSLQVGGQLARAIERPPALRMGALVLPAVEPLYAIRAIVVEARSSFACVEISVEQKLPKNCQSLTLSSDQHRYSLDT